MANPFDYINSISFKKNDLMENDPEAEKDYPAFMVNRGLSLYPDTVLQANEMNQRAGLDSKLAYDYYLNSIRPRKRFSKWPKKAKSDVVNIIKEYYNCSDSKALEYNRILNVEQIEEIRLRLNKGTNDESSR
jgi:hypothetical protein|tara:strand:+ start:246 stop:641 length:396 start_codon:yes stop_codon:yes gene_type:complete